MSSILEGAALLLTSPEEGERWRNAGVWVPSCFLSPLKGQKEAFYPRGRRDRSLAAPWGAVLCEEGKQVSFPPGIYLPPPSA